MTGLLRLTNTLIQAFPAMILARLLRLMEATVAATDVAAGRPPVGRALGTAASLMAVLMIKMIVENQYFHYVVQCSTEVRGALSGLIFDKSLRLPAGGSLVTHPDKTNSDNNNSNNNKDSDESTTTTKKKSLGAGGVLNLMQSDTSIIENAFMQIHNLWDAPLQIAMYTLLLYRYLGSSVFYGVAVLLAMIPLNSYTLRILNKLSSYQNDAKDARTKRTSEAIANMKLLKLQGWEHQFAKDIRASRHDELKRQSTRGVVRALNQAISNSVPALVLVVTLSAYIKTGRPFVASTIFTSISLFNQLRFPLFFYPMLIDSLANGNNAMRRISSFLSSDEVIPYVQHHPPLVLESNNSTGGSISIEQGNFLWSTARAKETTGENSRADGYGVETTEAIPALYDANLEVKPGEVVAVVGSVGSGKSALIKSLLGELVPATKSMVQNSLETSTDEAPVASKLNTTTSTSTPHVATHGNIAYCSQEAWLPKGTLRDAVVFGREYNEDRYRAAIRDAGLDDDIAEDNILKASAALLHDTDVGEGGSSLSGGQRARVALARALYSGDDTKVFLLDDCLAALDARVTGIVFDRLMTRLRNSGAATVLVTNDPNLPRRCDKVVLMQKMPASSSCSTIADVGTYDELLSRGHSLVSVSDIETHVAHDENKRLPTSSSGMKPEQKIKSSTEKSKSHSRVSVSVHREKTIRVVGGYELPANGTSDCCHADPECQAALEKCPDFLAQIDEENVEENTPDESDATPSEPKRESATVASADDKMTAGAVPRQTYVDYLRSVRKPVLIVAMIAAYLMSNGAQFLQQAIVAKWTEVGGGEAAAIAGPKYLRRLMNAAGTVSVFLWIRSFLTNRLGIRASEFLHSRMLDSVFSAPMSFFDATPSGQIMSRFGKEMETVDRGVPDSIQNTMFCFLQIIMSGVALAGVVTPAMMIPLAIVSLMYVSTMKQFRPGARDLKRIETVTRSPIYTHFGEALRGSEVIRSIPGSRLFWSTTHRGMTDTNLRAFYSVKAIDRWLSCRLETLGNVVVFTAAVASVWLTRLGRLKSGSAGWGLTQALAITGLMTWAVRCLTDLETNMMSVLRVKELTDLEREDVQLDKEAMLEATTAAEVTTPLPQDSSAKQNHSGTLDGWPSQGGIHFENVSMRYNELSKLVLKGVDLTLPAGTTLGIVGRTGSGKSSLLLTLFRLVEIEDGGRILIDGVDIRSVPLDNLRQSLAIIPQEPVLFAGTVAYNLDATGNASEESMWEALRAASPSLAEQFRRSGGLQSPVSEGGKNLSQGQRQLLCLARALVRQSKILVLDEATASVDPTTDQEVQATIRREFVNKGVTVMTVAHRLETVLGYDKIAVLGDGELIEYGSPKELLQNTDGELRQLVDADRESKRKGAKKAEDDLVAAS